MRHFLDFEKPIAELEGKIEELRRLSEPDGLNITEEISRLTSVADDAAVLGGLGRFRGRAVMVLGTEKGSDTESRIAHNFGMAKPEGYRKARRLIELSGRFALPVVTFIDTAGAFPGIDAEERRQAEAVARSIEACLEAPVPVVAVII